MPITIRPLHPAFAGEVSGVDCRKPLASGKVDEIEAGMDQYAVLVFRDQNLTDQQQLDFTHHFGELEGYNTPGHIRKQADLRLAPGMADFSNLDKSGAIMSDQDRVWFFKIGNRLWHSDSSFKADPGQVFAAARARVPSKGGNTEFADMRAAYDALDDEPKAEFEDLVCEHSLIYSREPIGFFDLTAEETRALPAGAPGAGAHPSGRPAANRSTSPRMPARSSAGRSPRRASSCAT